MRKKSVKRYDNNHVLLHCREYQRKDGLYLYKYKDGMGNIKVVYSSGLAELRKKERAINRDLEDGILPCVNNNITVNAMFAIYMKGKTELKESTCINYRYLYDKYIRGTLGGEQIVRVKYSRVKQFYIYMMKERGFKLSSLEIIHTILHSVFALALRDDYIRKNPTDGVLTELKRDNKWHRSRRHGLTEEQQEAFISYVATSRRYRSWLPLFTILLGTGCRIGEIIGLTWQDCDFEKNLLYINHSMTYHRQQNGKCGFGVSTPKTESGVRIIPMLSEVRQTLLELRKKQLVSGQPSVEIDGYTDFVLLNRNGSIYNPSCVNRSINRISMAYNCEEIERARQEDREPLLLPHFSVHTLRHTFCSRFCENETNVKVIQEIMGHSDIATTMNIYAEVAESKKQEIFYQLDGKIKISG